MSDLLEYFDGDEPQPTPEPTVYTIPLVDRPRWYINRAWSLWENDPTGDTLVASGMLARLACESQVRVLCNNSLNRMPILMHKLFRTHILNREQLRDLRKCLKIGNRVVHGYRCSCESFAKLLVGTCSFLATADQAMEGETHE